MAIDIAGFINTQEPVKSWTAAKKQEMLDRFCAARGYHEEFVKDESGNDTEELVKTKKEFFNEDVLNYIKMMFDGNSKKEAEEGLTYDELDFSV